MPANEALQGFQSKLDSFQDNLTMQLQAGNAEIKRQTELLQQDVEDSKKSRDEILGLLRSMAQQ